MVTAVEEMKKVISLADIMKVSDEESLLLTGASNYEDASDEFLKMGEDGNKISCNYTGKVRDIQPVLLSGVSKGACPLAHDFACKV